MAVDDVAEAHALPGIGLLTLLLVVLYSVRETSAPAAVLPVLKAALSALEALLQCPSFPQEATRKLAESGMSFVCLLKLVWKSFQSSRLLCLLKAVFVTGSHGHHCKPPFTTDEAKNDTPNLYYYSITRIMAAAEELQLLAC